MKDKRWNRILLGYVINILFQLAILTSQHRLQLLQFFMDLSQAYYLMVISLTNDDNELILTVSKLLKEVKAIQHMARKAGKYKTDYLLLKDYLEQERFSEVYFGF
jgi:hypothetical protein